MSANTSSIIDVEIYKNLRLCRDCGVVKTLDDFHRCGPHYRSRCRGCWKTFKDKKHQDVYKRHFQLDENITRECRRCGEIKSLKYGFYITGGYYQKVCKDCRKQEMMDKYHESVQEKN